MTTILNTIGVIGAGQMGSGIAHVCALAGYHVLLNDNSEERVRGGLATIDGNMARQVASGRITEAERKAAIGLIEPAVTLDALADADLAIETVTENETVKRKIFAESGSSNGAGGNRARHRHGRSDFRNGKGFCRQDWQAGGSGGGLSRLHGQPHPSADDQ
jgi:3-hydroxyisobutyrate dehydrogenase-like beta-hydroxyacid dehydrogenase